MTHAKVGTSRAPVEDPTLGIQVDLGAPPDVPAKNRLVCLGDSLTHGFQSLAIHNTDLSWPAIVARELGWAGLRYPRYGGPGGGFPLNLEMLLREIESLTDGGLAPWELPAAVIRVQRFMDAVEDYWERGPGSVVRPPSATPHVLAVYGYDLRDVLSMTGRECRRRIEKPSDDLVHQLVESADALAALRVFPQDPDATLVDAARALGSERPDGHDPDHGIETLVVFLGANNALQAATKLKIVWTEDDGRYQQLGAKNEYTVWRPEHFTRELEELARQVERIDARHVIWCTVPHVTVVPVARGIEPKLRDESRYFSHYTRPWIAADEFDAHEDENITGDGARDVDAAIDGYNDAIVDVVRRRREGGRDWRVLEIAGLLDRLASRRYIENPEARPPWWSPYPLPAELAALDPPPNSHFLASDGAGSRTDGGLFSLDGVHPTTVGYGLVAQEVITVMEGAGVQFRTPAGQARKEPVQVDFARLLRADTLVTAPPRNITDDLTTLGWFDERFDVFRRVLHPFV